MTQKDLIALARGLGTVLKDFSTRMDAKTKGLDGLPGRNGDGVADAVIDRDGGLVLTLSNGVTKRLGVVVGKNADPDELREQIAAAVAAIPRPKDGFSPDDLDFEWIPETRSLKIKLLREGVLVKEVEKPLNGIPLWKGTYAAGKSYVYGDITTWNGAWWIAKASTTEKPGDGKTAWQLTVMRGAEGERGKEGKAGRDGRDLTNLGADGSKWGK